MTAEPIVPYAYGIEARRIGIDRAPERLRGSHTIMPDGDVCISLPLGGRLTDREAKRLAWAILADLAPDDAFYVPEVVSYREATRLKVLAFLADGPKTRREIEQHTGWKTRVVQRRLAELKGDGRIVLIGAKNCHHSRWSLA